MSLQGHNEAYNWYQLKRDREAVSEGDIEKYIALTGLVMKEGKWTSG